MISPIHIEKLKHAEQLMNQGQFKEALHEVTQLEQLGDVTIVTSLECTLLKSYIHINLGDYKKGLQIAEKAFKDSQKHEYGPNMVDALIVATHALYWLGRYKEALQNIELGEQQLTHLAQDQPAEIAQRQSALLLEKGLITSAMGEIDRALEFEQQGLALAENLGHEQLIAKAFQYLGQSYRRKGDNDRAREYYQRSIALWEKINNKLGIIYNLNQLGILYNDLEQALEDAQRGLVLAKEIDFRTGMMYILDTLGLGYVYRGDFNQALECFHQSLANAKKLDSKVGIIYALQHIGFTYEIKGYLDEALTYLERSMVIGEEINFKIGISSSLQYIGRVYRRRGDLDQALKYFQQSLALREEWGNKIYITICLEQIGTIYRLKGELDLALECYKRIQALKGDFFAQIASLTQIGLIHRQKGDLDQAIVHLKQCLTQAEELEHHHLISKALFHLISVTIDKHMLTQAQWYLQRLQQINEQEDDNVIDQQYRLAKAIVLKTSPRSRYRGQAEELFEQVATEDVLDHELTVEALLNLCDILLSELRSSNDPVLLHEIQSYVNRLQEIAIQQGSAWLSTETLVLKSKLALVGLNLEDARTLLYQAQQLAKKHGLSRLVMQIASEHETFLHQRSQWEALIAQSTSLVERMDLAHLEAQVMRMIHTLAIGLSDKLLNEITKALQSHPGVISRQTQPLSLKERIIRQHPQIESDAISTAIINILERKKRLNISQLTEEVRKQRGRASRRIIRDRVNHLLDQGILEEVDEGYGRQLRVIPL